MHKNRAPSRQVPPGIRAFIRAHPLRPPSNTWSTSSSLDLDTDTLSYLGSSSTLSLAFSHWSRGSRPRFKIKRPYPEFEGSRMYPGSKEMVERIYLETRQPGVCRLGEEIPVESSSTGKRTSGQGARSRYSQSERPGRFFLARPRSQRMSASPSTQHRDPSPRMTGAGPSTPPQRPTVRFQEPNNRQYRSPRPSRPVRSPSPVPEREPPPRGERFVPGCVYDDRGSSAHPYRRFSESERCRRPRSQSVTPQIVSRSPQSQSDVRVEERYPRSCSEPLPEIVEVGYHRMTGSTWFTANGSRFQPERVRFQTPTISLRHKLTTVSSEKQTLEDAVKRGGLLMRSYGLAALNLRTFHVPFS